MTTVYNQLYLLQIFSFDSKELGNNVNYFLIILGKDCVVIVVISGSVDLDRDCVTKQNKLLLYLRKSHLK